jgi:hypothetical protein
MLLQRAGLRPFARVPIIRRAMWWRADPREILAEAAAELAALGGDAVKTLVVYGSAAGAGFRPERSDVNLAAVLEPLEFVHLQRIAQWWTRWRRHRVAAPLVLSLTELERSRDVFPLELLDIQARHRTLAGAELFADLVVDPEAVRAECEREAKGKLLRLRALYLELAGSTRDLHALMLDSRKTFLHVVRGLLYLRGVPWSGHGAEVVRAFERHFACALPVLAALEEHQPAGPVAERFGAYLDEIELLATVADREASARA